MSSSSREDSQLTAEQKKRKRMLSNRESARRSRIRKQQHLDDLLSQEAKLKNDKTRMLGQIDMLSQKYAQVDSENMILRAQVMELSERLRSVNSVLSFMEDLGTIDVGEMSEQLLEPWQLPCMQSIVASPDMFLC